MSGPPEGSGHDPARSHKARSKRPSISSVTTINPDGSRYFVHPADVRGFWTTARRVVAAALLALYALLPVIPIRGNPAVFLDIARRKLHLFGATFMFQDLWLLFFLITGLGFGLFFVTSLAGRIWCGWACPQTVFLDHVIRRIERWIEGDALARRALDTAPWSATKIFKRTLKHGLFFLFAALIAHILLSYFVSLPGLYKMLRTAPAAHWDAFLFVFALAGVLYFDFAWFREQFCIVMCPYGRLQSALIDDNSIVVGYDVARGEPRGRPGTTTGDCVDCRRCVQVCPTGIDIRQGLQIECIACEACIDACDEVMDRLERPRGLIRHDSMNALTGNPGRLLRPRLFFYLAFTLIGALAFLFAASQLRPVAFSATRMAGAPYVRDGGVIRNNFLVRLAGKRPETESYRIVATAVVDGMKTSGATDAPLALPPGEEVVQPLILTVPDANFHGNFDVHVEVRDANGAVVATKKLPFLGPFREGMP